MKTAGKKTLKKPEPGRAVGPSSPPREIVIRFLPFLQLDPEKATLEGFLTVGNSCIVSEIMDYPKEEAIARIKKMVKGHEKQVLEHLQTTLTGIQKMIYIATVDHSFSEKETDELTRDFIHPALDRCSFYAIWERPEKSFILPTPDHASCYETWEEVFNGFRSWLVYWIAESFTSFHGLPSHGSMLVSACPICRKIFQKKRKDQIFCSIHCRGLAGVRRQRSKSKT